jgi:hypothetical protein
MEWRCTWCGKPHEDNDPPCEECGHHKFERAVQQVNTETVAGQEYVWVCTACGRYHQKHSPPCSRCGNVDLEKQEPDYSDLEEIGSTSYLDILEPKYAIGYLAVAVLGIVLIAGFTGIIALPGIGGPPEPPTAPGQADTYANVSLDAVEAAYVMDANRNREAASTAPLENPAALEDAATAFNRERVIATVENESGPSTREVVSRYEPDCRGELTLATPEAPPVWVFDVEDTATAAGTATNLQETFPVTTAGLDDPGTVALGMDIHVGPDEMVYLTLLRCERS